jgi:hypothetical protein
VTNPVDLAFDPSQPRDRQGKWSRIAGAIERGAAAVGRSIEQGDTARGTQMMLQGVGMPLEMPGRSRPLARTALRTPPPPRTAGLLRSEATHLIREHEQVRPTATKFAPEKSTWQAMAEFEPRETAAQRASGIWGPGRSYADHTAALAKLNPAQRRLYTQHVTAGKGPYEALQLARKGGKPPPGRLGRLEARVEHYINTPPKGQPRFFGSAVPPVGYANEAPMETIYDLAKVHPSETAGGRKSALKRGLAIAPPSPGAPPGFPITDARHWDKARQAIGRVKNPARRAAVARLLRKTAARFGKTAALHSSWAAPGGKKATAHSNDGEAIEMARRLPVMDPADIVVARGSSGQAVIRHRRGGGLIGVITHTEDGWTAEPDGGQAGTGHTHQRGALVELLGLYNRSTGTAQAAPQPLQPPPVQTPLMQQFNVPAIRLATPATGTSDGGREVSGGGSVAGLNPKGVTIYRKLRRKMPADRALSFARRAQTFGGKRAS